MNLDWKTLATIFLAVVLAMLVYNKFLAPKVASSGVTVITSSPAKGVPLTGNPITDYLNQNYPDAVK